MRTKNSSSNNINIDSLSAVGVEELKTFDLRRDKALCVSTNANENQNSDLPAHHKVLSEDCKRELNKLSVKKFDDMVKSGIQGFAKSLILF